MLCTSVMFKMAAPGRRFFPPLVLVTLTFDLQEEEPMEQGEESEESAESDLGKKPWSLV